MINTIHQIWIGDKVIPDRYRNFCDHIKNSHPDYEYKLWDNKTIDNEFKKDKVYKALTTANVPYSAIVNYLRVMIIHKYGGWYIDVDSELINPINPLQLPTDKESIFGWMDKIIEIAVFYSNPENPMLLEMAKIYSELTTESFYTFKHRENITDIIKSYTTVNILGQRYFYSHLRTSALYIHSKFMHSFDTKNPSTEHSISVVL
jgi:mannosyltransferase OCH1-like enzyme